MSILLLGLIALLAWSPAAPPDTPFPERAATAWGTVSEEGTLRLERGQAVAFRGTGQLEFDSDRTFVRAEPRPLSASVNGERVRGRRTLTSDDVLDLRAADGTAWTIRRASQDEVDEVAGATRIRDDHPDSPARIDTDGPTAFFLHVGADGGSTFIYPETD